MSRLESFIRRMTAQRDVLDHVAALLTLPPGDVLEIGLGNGRTFSHLCERFPGRRIVAFDRAMLAHGSSAPQHFVQGEIRDTLAGFVGKGAALAHADIGQGYPDRDAETLTWLPDLMAGVLAPGGIAASGLPLEHPGLVPLPLPATVDPGRYFLYRRA